LVYHRDNFTFTIYRLLGFTLNLSSQRHNQSEEHIKCRRTHEKRTLGSSTQRGEAEITEIRSADIEWIQVLVLCSNPSCIASLTKTDLLIHTPNTVNTPSSISSNTPACLSRHTVITFQFLLLCFVYYVFITCYVSVSRKVYLGLSMCVCSTTYPGINGRIYASGFTYPHLTLHLLILSKVDLPNALFLWNLPLSLD
jgi:hypothetical protein